MKTILFAAVILLAGFAAPCLAEEASAPPAAAPAAPAAAPAAPATDDFETPLQNAEGRHALAAIGKSYRFYSRKLGCDHFVWGTISADSSQFTLKYLPAGKTLADWDRMVVMSVGALPNSKRDSAYMIQKIAETEGFYQKNAKVTEDRNFVAPNGEHTMFLRYTMPGLDAAAVYMRTGNAGSLIQLEARATSLTDAEVAKIELFVNKDAGKTAAPAPKSQGK